MHIFTTSKMSHKMHFIQKQNIFFHWWKLIGMVVSDVVEETTHSSLDVRLFQGSAQGKNIREEMVSPGHINTWWTRNKSEKQRRGNHMAQLVLFRGAAGIACRSNNNYIKWAQTARARELHNFSNSCSVDGLKFSMHEK